MNFIKMANVCVRYPISQGTRKFIFTDPKSDGIGGKIDRNKRYVEALSDFSLNISEGDRIGVIGHNGAGKSSLLRVLSGILEPTSGSIQINGNVCPLLNIGLGINQDLSGFENIILRGLYLGIERRLIQDKFLEISEFSGLNGFLNLPVRTYSTGMKARLAFSVLICFEPEILILDEFLSVGDSSFSLTARQRLLDIIDQTKILVMASHSTQVIQNNCNKLLWVEKGKLKYFGDLNIGIDLFKMRKHEYKV